MYQAIITGMGPFVATIMMTMNRHMYVLLT